MVMNKNNDKLVEHLVVMLRRIFEQCSDQDAEYLSEESTEGMILNIVRWFVNARCKSTNIATFVFEIYLVVIDIENYIDNLCFMIQMNLTDYHAYHRYVRHTGTSKFAYQLRIKFCNMIGEVQNLRF